MPWHHDLQDAQGQKTGIYTYRTINVIGDVCLIEMLYLCLLAMTSAMTIVLYVKFYWCVYNNGYKDIYKNMIFILPIPYGEKLQTLKISQGGEGGIIKSSAFSMCYMPT